MSPSRAISGPKAFSERRGIGAIRYSPALGVPGNNRSAGAASNLEEEEGGRLYRILPPNELVTELRRRFLQCGDQIMGSRRNGARLPVNDLLRIGGFAIEFVIGFIVRPKG